MGPSGDLFDSDGAKQHGRLDIFGGKGSYGIAPMMVVCGYRSGNVVDGKSDEARVEVGTGRLVSLIARSEQP